MPRYAYALMHMRCAVKQSDFLRRSSYALFTRGDRRGDWSPRRSHRVNIVLLAFAIWRLRWGLKSLSAFEIWVGSEVDGNSGIKRDVPPYGYTHRDVHCTLPSCGTLPVFGHHSPQLRGTKVFSSKDQRKLPRILNVPAVRTQDNGVLAGLPIDAFGSQPAAAVEFVGVGVNIARWLFSGSSVRLGKRNVVWFDRSNLTVETRDSNWRYRDTKYRDIGISRLFKLNVFQLYLSIERDFWVWIYQNFSKREYTG